MKLRPLSQIMLQQTLQKHQNELEQLAELLKDNDAAPSSALLDISKFTWVLPDNDATGASE